MASSDLCVFCSAIDLSRLRLPTVGDIRSGKGARGYPIPGKSDRLQAAYRYKTLGTLDRVRKSSKTCGLCFLVLDIFTRNIGRYKYWDQHKHPNPDLGVEITYSGQMSPAEGEEWEDIGTDAVYIMCLDITFSDTSSGSISVGKEDLYKIADDTSGKIAHAIRAASTDLGGSAIYHPFEDAHLLPSQTLYGIRDVSESIDIDLISSWYQNCVEQHGPNCGHSGTAINTLSQARNFQMRLVDVATDSIVTNTIQEGNWPKYIALSYVWGFKQRLMLNQSNKATLERPGALNGTVSQTIADAISLTRILQIPFIWVDALCIVQDDKVDKAEQIGRMCDIYANSAFTLVAASGMNAESGIPGFSIARNIHQPRVTIPERSNCEALTLVGAVDPPPQWNSNVLSTTVWATRGWTMQEKAVSRRVLMFTESVMYWMCGDAYWTEEVFMESMLARVKWYCLNEADFSLNSRHKIWNAPDSQDQLWFNFTGLVREYTRRCLTVAGDRLDAFSAVMQQVKEREGEHFLWGIPTSRFHLGLCWEPHRAGLERITCDTTLEITSLKRRVKFPSWSWIGWQGVIQLQVEDDDLEHGLQPEIACFVLRNSPSRLVSTSRICFDDRGLRIPMPPSKSPLVVSMDDIISQPGWSEKRVNDTPDDQVLVFWTNLVRLRIVSRPFVEKLNRYCHRILDTSGQEVGYTAPHHSTAMEKSPVEADFILMASDPGTEAPPVKIILQVKWEDGVAHRLNIGQINADAWEKANPERVLVLLA